MQVYYVSAVFQIPEGSFLIPSELIELFDSLQGERILWQVCDYVFEGIIGYGELKDADPETVNVIRAGSGIIIVTAGRDIVEVLQFLKPF